MPEMMKNHMMGSMRDPLVSFHKIQASLAKGGLDMAAEIAEKRIGMSSLGVHDASHMAAFMPKGMKAIGTEMHHAVSRFALVAKEGEVMRAVGSLTKVTQQCITCHAAYRIIAFKV